MTKLDYKTKLTQIKSEIHALTEQSRAITKDYPKSFNERRKMSKNYFKARYPLKVNWLRQAYFHLLALRFSKSINNKIEESEIDETRNALIAVLALWEEDLDKQFLEFYEDKYPVHLTMTNLEVAEHFRAIGYVIDKMEEFLSEKETIHRKQSALLRIRYKFLMMFCNALNFKKLITDIEQMGETYSSSKDILNMLYTEFDDCIDRLWKQYFANDQTNLNIFEMQRSLNLISFIKKLASFLLDKDRMLTYKKKYKVWNKYIIKATEETPQKKNIFQSS